MVWERLRERKDLTGRELTVLVNNRPDRGSRTADMAQACALLHPRQVLLLGAGQGFMRMRLKKLLPWARVVSLKAADTLDWASFSDRDAVLMIGNIAGEGRALMSRLREEGELLV